MTNWNTDIPMHEMKLIMLLDGWTRTETKQSVEFTKDNSLLRVEKHFPSHLKHRALCRVLVTNKKKGDVTHISFSSRIEALRHLNIREDDGENDIEGFRGKSTTWRMED